MGVDAGWGAGADVDWAAVEAAGLAAAVAACCGATVAALVSAGCWAWGLAWPWAGAVGALPRGVATLFPFAEDWSLGEPLVFAFLENDEDLSLPFMCFFLCPMRVPRGDAVMCFLTVAT